MAAGDRDAPTGAGGDGESGRTGAPGSFPDAAVLAHIRDAVVVIDQGDRILYWGPGAEALFGIPAAEALGRPVGEVQRWRWLDPADEAAAYAALERDGFWRGEDIHLLRSGEERHAESAVTVIRGEGGARIGLLAVIRDETDRYRVEAALRDSEARFRSLAENAPDLVARFDRRHRHLYINQAGARATGKDPGQILGRTPRELGFPEDVATYLEDRFQRVLSTGEQDVVEFSLPGPGSPREFESRLVPERGPGGAVETILVLSRDVTVRNGDQRRLASLQAITSALSRALTAQAAADVIVERGALVLGAHCGLLALHAEGRVTILHHAGLPEELAEAWRSVPLDQPSPLAHVVRAADEAVFRTKEAWHRASPQLGAGPPPAGLEALAMLPLRADGAVLGVLGFGFPTPRRFQPEELAFLRAVAAQAAQALERARLYEAEGAARAAAQEADAAKDQFLALISHELRNPLSAMKTALHLLRRDVLAEGRGRRALEIVGRNADLLARLVNDLLDLSRVTRGQLQLQRAPVLLDEVARAAVQAYEGEAQEAGLALRLDTQLGLWVQADLDRLQQVAMNLVSNAMKFTRPGGSITVRAARAAPDRGRIEVEDTGIGVDPARLASLFEMFQQGEVGAQRRPGLGIGLALVKGIVERHGGRVWAESDGVGRGARFLVELALVAGPRERAPSSPRVEEGPIARVLLVEDNADTRSLITDALILSGYEVLAAASGEEALDLLREEPRPDVILSDIGLPGIDGCELLTRVRALPGLSEVPAFAVTGYGQEQDVERGRRAGFVGHFVKPVDMAALDQRLRAWLRVG